MSAPPSPETTEPPPSPVPSALGFALSSWKRAGFEGGWVVAGQFSVALAGLIGIRLLTELAPREVFGNATLLLGVVILGRSIFVAPFSNAQLRFHPEYEQRGVPHWFTRQVARYTWLSTILFCAVGLIGYLAWAGLTGHAVEMFLIPLLGVLIFNESAKTLQLARFSAERRQARSAIWYSIESWLAILLSAAALYWSKTVAAYLSGQALAGLVMLGLARVAFRKLAPDTAAPTEDPRDLFRRMMAYGLPLVPLMLLGWVCNIGDRYVLGALTGSAEVGLYAAAYGVASRPILMVAGVFNNFARPILFQATSQGDANKARKIFVLWMGAVAGAGGAGALALWLLGKWVAMVLLAAEYRHNAPAIFFWVGLGYAMYGVVQIIENRLMSFGRSGQMFMPAIAAAVATVILDFALIPRYGGLGAAQATAGAFLIHLLLITLVLRRSSGAAKFPAVP